MNRKYKYHTEAKIGFFVAIGEALGKAPPSGPIIPTRLRLSTLLINCSFKTVGALRQARKK